MKTSLVADRRTALVTGGTSGIGRSLAEALAGAGLTVGIVARDARRGEEARGAIATASGNERVELFTGDLSDLSSVRRLAEAVAEAHQAIDILVHCAAVYSRRRAVTADGLETMFATNLAGPFLLTNLVLDQLREGPARILVLSAPSTVQLDFDDLQAERRFRSLTAFGASKAADLLFTFELARRLEGSGVTANAIHPGLVRTNLMRDAPAPLRWATWLVSRSPARAVESIVPVALAPEYEGRTGRFYKAGREIDAPSYTRDPEVARRLWDATASLAELGQGGPHRDDRGESVEPGT
jgi:NAD(P)-dependent dehydrogenase (short-subunit alcohol dehydrogenase family)